jgi:protein-disulfide isomerase
MDQSNQSERVENTNVFNREKMISTLVIAELVMLLVFGWQLFSLKQDLQALEGQARSDRGLYTSPITPDEDAPDQENVTESAGPIEISVRSSDHIRGNENAPVTIVTYSDFECPFCADMHPIIENILEDNEETVRLVYRHFPLSFHRRALKAAEASECAAEQDKFWEYHDILFENQNNLAGGVFQLKEWASDLGLDQKRFDDCLDSNEKSDDVKNDRISGTSKGVTGTPTFFVNGNILEGAQPMVEIQRLIDNELNSLEE